MHYWLIGFISVTFLIFVMFWFLNVLYKRTNQYRNDQLINDRYRSGVPEHLQMVNLGSGPSFYDIDYDYIPVRGFTFARPPQSFAYDLKLMKRYQNNIDKGAVVVIVVCPLGFGYNRAYEEKAYHRRYYDVLPLSEIDMLGSVDYFLYRHFPLLLHPKSVVKILKDVPPVILKPQNVDQERIDWEKVGNSTEKGWIYGAALDDLKNSAQADSEKQLVAADEKRKIMKELLDFCAEREWKPVIVIPPFSEEAVNMISKEFKERFVDENLRLVNQVGVPVLDYFGTEGWDHEYFNNVCFMNSRGAERFTKMLWKDIMKIVE